jgi:hypothetical protein
VKTAAGRQIHSARERIEPLQAGNREGGHHAALTQAPHPLVRAAAEATLRAVALVVVAVAVTGHVRGAARVLIVPERKVREQRLAALVNLRTDVAPRTASEHRGAQKHVHWAGRHLCEHHGRRHPGRVGPIVRRPGESRVAAVGRQRSRGAEQQSSMLCC